MGVYGEVDNHVDSLYFGFMVFLVTHVVASTSPRNSVNFGICRDLPGAVWDQTKKGRLVCALVWIIMHFLLQSALGYVKHLYS